MLLPRIFDTNLVDNFFNDAFSFPFDFAGPSTKLMSTNIKDLGDEYLLEIELPGFDKKDIKAQLENGYLTITAEKEETKEENDKKGRLIHRERYSGSCKRRFYVGNHLKEEDFMGSFDKGILKMSFPKENKDAKTEEKKYIAIE